MSLRDVCEIFGIDDYLGFISAIEQSEDMLFIYLRLIYCTILIKAVGKPFGSFSVGESMTEL